MARGLSLVAGGAVSARSGLAEHHRLSNGLGGPWRLPPTPIPTLSELFAAHPRDGGWAAFLLAQLDTSNVAIAVEQARAAQAVAQAALDGALSDLERTRQLASGGSVARATLEKAEIGERQARAQLAQATAALKHTQEQLRDASLTAPFDGTVAELNASEGGQVTEGTTLVRVERDAPS